MSKIGEFPLERSDGARDMVDLYELGTFDHDPLIFETSDGRRGTPYLRPLGEGDTGLIVEASDGTRYQANKVGILVIDDFETGDFRNWGAVHGPSITTSHTYQGSYAMLGSAGDGNQRVQDNQRDHGNLPRYQQKGETVRAFAYYPTAEHTYSSIARIRWGFGGIFESSTDPALYAQWNIQDSGLHLIHSDGHNVLATTYDFSYPGGEWWAVEVTWGDPTITVRLVDYSDPDNPAVQDSLSYDYSLDDSVLGHQWYVWNGTPDHLYADYAVIPPA